MDTISFKRHRFPPEIIRRAVWLYARFTLSYRDVEDLLAERGLDISYESVRRWFLKFGAPIARNLRHTRPVAVGTILSDRPPHRSQRAELPHWALTSGNNAQSLFGIRVYNSQCRKPSFR